MTRVYVPLSLVSLGSAHAEGRLRVSGDVTVADVPAGAGPDEEEQAEVDALEDAADLSLFLLAEAPGDPRQRVVAVADVPDAAVSPDPEGGWTADAEVPWSDVVAYYVDETEATDDVTSLVDALGDDGDPPEELVATVYDRTMLWYDASEPPPA